MKKLLALILALGSLVCSAQNNLPTGTQTSPNLVYTTLNPYGGPAGTEPYTWSGFVNTQSQGGGTSGGSQPGYNGTVGQFMFGYMPGTVAYNYALSTALKNSGMTWLGYNYSWQYFNQDYSRGSLSANVNFTAVNGTYLHNKSWTLGPTTEGWTTVSGTEVFANPAATSNIASFGLSFTGQDDRWWAGYYGPQVRYPSITVNYTFDACYTNPLSSPTCPGYAEAYKTQQCTANPLYDPTCPGYAAALLTQQCSANPLLNPQCPGYATALNQQLNQQLTKSNESTKTDPAKVTVVSSTVDSVLTTPSTTSATSTSPASVTSVVTQPATTIATNPTAAAATAAAAPPLPSAAKQEEKAQEQKKTDGEVRQAERKASGDPQNARKEVAQRAKDLAQNASKATTMEAQTANQGLVVGLMGYVPGFSAYQNVMVPDVLAGAVARQYMKPTVDNRAAQRALSGASDALHQRMVEQQYK